MGTVLEDKLKLKLDAVNTKSKGSESARLLFPIELGTTRIIVFSGDSRC